MNTKISYVTLAAVTYDTPPADGDLFQFAVTLTSGLSGLIRNDSYLTVTFTGSSGSESTFTIPCYVDGVLIDSHTFTTLSLPNNSGTSTITQVELEFDYLEDIWRNINFTYRGSVTEKINLLIVVS